MAEEPSYGPKPAVFARLRDEAEVKLVRREPPRSARWLGWLLCVGILAFVIAAAVGSSPL